jgi:hypothetical protein
MCVSGPSFDGLESKWQGHQPHTSHRTPFVRLRVRTLATRRDGNESRNGLRGEVAFRFVLPRLLKKRTIAGVKGVAMQLAAVVARSSVTQKPTRFVISWRQHNL